MVQDPIAKVKFPKNAAGAKLDMGGRTYYFIDETTLREFQQQQGTKK
jgi:YHS domain-containing protein